MYTDIYRDSFKHCVTRETSNIPNRSILLQSDRSTTAARYRFCDARARHHRDV